jgi:hypothetical protein
MKLLLITLLLTLAGCASKPVIAKDCVKAEGSNLFVCKKF